MLHEKSKEIDGLNKEFQRQIQVLVEDHKKEVDVSIWRYLFQDKAKKIRVNLSLFSLPKMQSIW